METKYDGPIHIAEGRSRKTAVWTNKEMRWSELAAQLGETSRTGETAAEYARLSKAQQDEIKDVGGFVGGTLKNGRRRNGYVLSRSVLTLDLDFAAKDFVGNFLLLYDYAAVIYSTHKHTPEKPRLRLVMPLSRPVAPDEYEAVGRRLAGDLGLDQFDPTTFEPARLMYWPSTSRDGTYLYERQDGPWLDADAMLSRYADWRDVTLWPTSEKEEKVYRKQAKKQGEPSGKPGLIGAFCRAYTIKACIETFLPDVYTPVCGDRYTYAGGSTAGGLVVYDDKFAYSHHATDPAAGRLCNAYDLVRMHLFGELDEDCAADADIAKLPSTKAMNELAAKDEMVIRLNASERAGRAAAEFDVPVVETDPEWEKNLERSDKGGLKTTINNFRLILSNDSNLAGRLWHNGFSQRLVLRRDAPWRKVNDSLNGDAWNDADDAALRHYFETTYQLYHRQKLTDAVESVAQKNRYHPVREYLESLEWDGTERLETLLIDYFGAEDNAYNRTVTAKTLIAAVARVMRPGCKHDEMLIMTGRQGTGKSTMFAKLGHGWYSNSLTSVADGKDSYEQLQGVWIVEMDELNAMRKKDAEEVKSFLSKQQDIYRAAYARRSDVYPRQCVFVGTTNKPEFLQDATGERRFWPVDLDRQPYRKNVWTELDGEVDQIWAEAVVRYRAGEEWHISGEMAEYAAEVQEAHKLDNPKAGMIGEYLDLKLPADWYDKSLPERREWLAFDGDAENGNPRTSVCAAEIWYECFRKERADMRRQDTNELHDLMRLQDGWVRMTGTKRFGDYGFQRVWYERK